MKKTDKPYCSNFSVCKLAENLLKKLSNNPPAYSIADDLTTSLIRGRPITAFALAPDAVPAGASP
jgi:hypothetical protein